MKRVFVDTAGWFAFARADDPDHPAVKDALERWRGRLVTSNAVFSETVTLIRYRAGHAAAQRAGELLRNDGIVELLRADGDDEEQAWSLFRRHSDKAYSFTDCLSFAMMRRLGIDRAVTTDRHFRQAGFETDPG